MRGYEVQPVVHRRAGRGRSGIRRKILMCVAAHVQPLDVWYLLPIEVVGRAKSLRFYPDIRSRTPRWEEYREKLGRCWSEESGAEARNHS